MKNQLPKSERKYRSKIIAGERLDKYWQRVLDEYMGRRVTKFLGITYKKCYFDKNLKNKIFPTQDWIAMTKRAFQSLSVAIKNTDGSVRSLYDVLSEIADKYVEMGNVYPLFIDEARGDMVEKI